MQSPEASVHPTEVRWSALRRQDPEALRLAELEALELARALAVESLASDGDAELVELAERRRHLSRAAWPEEPLEGYRLQSSLGAFVVARVAIAWVPTGQTGLRHTPLGPDGILRALTQQGVEAVVARSILGLWQGPQKGFVGREEGLDAGLLAGLAERSLTAEERDQALAQVAVSTRDLSRLGACLLLGRAVRRLLPVLADDALGEDFVATLALVATDRAERAVELLPVTPPGLRARTVWELAHAIVQLSEGRCPDLAEDAWAPSVPRLGEGADPTVDAPTPSEEDEEEDVLEIVEEAVDPEALEPWEGSFAPEPPAWWPGAASKTEPSTALERLGQHRSLARRHSGALGFSSAPLDARGAPVPPDPRLERSLDDGVSTPTEQLDLGDLEGPPQLEDSPAEPFLPSARSALRCILDAVKGQAPDSTMVEQGGALHWVFARSAAVAHLARGDLEGALERLRTLDTGRAPEQRWIQDRKVRYQGRAAEPLSQEEACAAGAAIALDLARSLARTLTGAFATAAQEE